MPTRPSSLPTEAELELLHVLWQRGASTVREVHEAVNESRGVAYTTTLKVLQIMFEKGLVERDDSERSHLYKAVAKPEETKGSMVKAFMDRVFGGSAADLMLSALGSSKTSAKDMQRIQDMLKTSNKSRRGK